MENTQIKQKRKTRKEKINRGIILIDIHNHILWGLDDAPNDVEESLKMLKTAQKNGIKKIVATSHYIEGSYQPDSKEIKRKILELRKIKDEKNIDIEIFQGLEVFLSVDILEYLNQNKLLTINNSKYLLIEFPFLNIPLNSDKIIYQIMKKGLRPIIAHPERTETIINDASTLIPFIDMGCLTQVNAGSITGYFGERIKKTALELIERDMVYTIASDSHNSHERKPNLSEAYIKIEKLKGKEYVKKLKKTAEIIIDDEDAEYIEPKITKKKSILEKFFSK